MDNKKLTAKLIASSNLSSINGLTSFVESYIEKLIYDVVTYVDDRVTIGKIEIFEKYTGANELAQRIVGVPTAYSVIDGSDSALTAFAEQYSHLGVKEFDVLAKEVIVDFLNLHNGLFIVQLSKDNICELTLDVPKQNGLYNLNHQEYKSIIAIPIIFTFGTINFLLCEA